MPLYTDNKNKTLIYYGGAAIDVDGSPKAYHPKKGMGLDFIQNAGIFFGRNKRIWGVATDSNGDPYIQKEGEYEGYYISTTSLQDSDLKKSDIHRYVDSCEVSYCVVPIAFRNYLGKAVIMDYNGKQSYGIVADCGPRWGELSVRAANDLGINSSPKNGGVSKGVLYVIRGDLDVRNLWLEDKFGDKLSEGVKDVWDSMGGTEYLKKFFDKKK